MAADLTFEQHVVIPNRSISEVFHYVSDFGRAAEWRVEVVDSSMSPPAPTGVWALGAPYLRWSGRRLMRRSLDTLAQRLATAD